MKLFFFFFLMLLFSECNNNKSSSPYDEILSQPLFSAITDSIRKQPRRDDLYFRRAVLLNKNNLSEPALADFLKAWSLAKEESYAVGVSNILLEKKPAQVNALLLKADLLEKKGDTANMISSLEKAYSIIPFNREISNKLAYQYAESKNAKALQLADSLISK